MDNEKAEYLEKETKLIWQTLEEYKAHIEKLEKDIINATDIAKKKSSDYEKEAQQSSEQAKEIVEKLNQEFENASDKSEKIINISVELDELKKETAPLCARIINDAKKSQEKISKIEKNHNEFQTQYQNLVAQINPLSQNIVTTQSQVTTSKQLLDSLQTAMNDTTSLALKVKTIHQESVDMKSQIEDIYDKVFGYTYNDKNGLEQEELGLKHELETSYNEIEKGIVGLKQNIEKISNDSQIRINNLIKEKDIDYNKIKEEITSLLPAALTAGLSHAYQKKREDEEEVSKKANKSFTIAIVFLSLFSLLPIAIGLFLLLKLDYAITDVIYQIPRLVMLIVPLYIPMLWMGTTANKQLKLSKRLIEEYSHKEVLSKTFEGLSKQIDCIKEKNSSELRIKLLYNVINMTSNNPGQLIKGFDQSDHPLVEVLNNSAHLNQSLDKFAKIPGVGIIIDKIKPLLNKKTSEKAEELNKAVRNVNDIGNE